MQYTMQAARDTDGNAEVGKRRGQGGVPIFAPGIVRLQGRQPPFDGRRFRRDHIAQVAMVGVTVP